MNPDHLEVVSQSENAKRVRKFHNTGYAHRTRCINGHDITAPGAIFEKSNGERTCYICQRASWARARARQKERKTT